MTPNAFRSRLDRNIQHLNDQIVGGSFSFERLRPIKIPKSEEGYRVICVPTVKDRLVQRRLVDHLVESDKLKIKNKVSFGFIRGVGGVPKAIKKARNLRNEYNWAFKSDITSFFDQIDRDVLVRKIQATLGRSSVVPLLNLAVGCEIDDSDTVLNSEIAALGIIEGRGLRQGMPLSPVLSNLVLKEFDRYFEKRGAHLVRYADDFVLFAKSKDECQEYFHLVRERLLRLGHVIPDIGDGLKTVIQSPSESIEFLGFEVAPPVAKSSQYRILIPSKAHVTAKDEILKLGDFEHAQNNYRNFTRTIGRINSTARGYANVYTAANNFKDFESHIENCKSQAYKNLLSELFGKDAFDKLSKRQREFLEIVDTE